MMRGVLLFLGVLALLGGAVAQEADAEACDPTTSGIALIDLQGGLGKLACTARSVGVDSGKVMVALTGTLNSLTSEQLTRLPALMEVLVSAEPSAITPFLQLSAAELQALAPLLSEVPADTLKAVLPVLAAQSEATVARMIRFLRQIPSAQLEKLSPMFGRITEGQVNILVKALQVLPGHAWDMLTAMMQAVGPVTDVAVSAKQQLAKLPGNSSAPAAAAAASTVDAAANVTGMAKAAKVVRLPMGAKISFGGRRLLQEQEEADAAAGAGEPAAAPAGACDPEVEGLEVGVVLLPEFGPVVCKFGADELRPVLEAVLASLNGLPAERVKQLPQLTEALAGADPAAFAVFFDIPAATLQALIPAIAGLEPAALLAQMKLLAAQPRDTLQAMVSFLKATPASQAPVLINMVARITDKQADTVAAFMNALSWGQVALALHLLDTFGFAVDAIGRAIPPKEARDVGYFAVGPVHVHVPTAPKLITLG